MIAAIQKLMARNPEMAQKLMAMLEKGKGAAAGAGETMGKLGNMAGAKAGEAASGAARWAGKNPKAAMGLGIGGGALGGGAAGYGMADDDDTEELLKALGLA